MASINNPNQTLQLTSKCTELLQPCSTGTISTTSTTINERLAPATIMIHCNMCRSDSRTNEYCTHTHTRLETCRYVAYLDFINLHSLLPLLAHDLRNPPHTPSSTLCYTARLHPLYRNVKLHTSTKNESSNITRLSTTIMQIPITKSSISNFRTRVKANRQKRTNQYPY